MFDTTGNIISIIDNMVNIIELVLDLINLN